MKWESTHSNDIDYTDELPRTKIIRPHDLHLAMGQEVEQADLDNITHLESLISKHSELSLLIEHYLLVNGKVNYLHHRVNLIKVACRQLAAYVAFESAAKGKDALGADKKSLKAIVVLALGLRKLLDKPVRDSNLHNEVAWINNFYPKSRKVRSKRTCTIRGTSYRFIDVNGLSIDKLLPSPSKQKEVLTQMLLNITPD